MKKMNGKKFKVIENENIGSNVWMQDPSIPNEDIDLFNDFFKQLGEENGKIDLAQKLIWNKKHNTKIQLIK